MPTRTKEEMHKIMVANRSKGTRIEVSFAKLLWHAGVRYRKNDRSVYGTPDFVMKGLKIAIFCDGEFWHGRYWEKNKNSIRSNTEYWYPKIERNIERDKEVSEYLTERGWKVFRFWETDIKKEPDKCLKMILDYINEIKRDAKAENKCKKYDMSDVGTESLAAAPSTDYLPTKDKTKLL